MSKEDMRHAIKLLARSERGAAALEGLLKWFDDGADGLDADNQNYVLIALMDAWRFPGSFREAIENAVGADRTEKAERW